MENAEQVRQLTTQAQNHVLTNINVWSPDGKWIVYDVRSGNEFNGDRIEQVNVDSGEIEILYESVNGANCGVVTYSPTESKVVFIIGPENPSADWNYSFSRRRGGLIDTRHPGALQALDAMNYAPPFKPGALRGGSHVHVFSPDGQWVSFTYEDEVLARLDSDASAPQHQKNLRTIGISAPYGPVTVSKSHHRNNEGDYFSALVAQITESPVPGSDEISKAFEEGWIGHKGYLKPDGSRQRRALAFQGHVTQSNGDIHAEVFIVDLPDDPTLAGQDPLQGDKVTRPYPPKGAVQRRLTYTLNNKFPGVSDTPRHWLRSSPDGSAIAFLMKDDFGIVQLWTISPNGGAPEQITFNPFSVESAFTWSPDGQQVSHVMDGSICVTHVSKGRTKRLTTKRTGFTTPSPDACVFSPNGRWIAYTRRPADSPTRFAQIYIVSNPTASN